MTVGTRRIRFDPHVHTEASPDPRGTVADVLRQSERRGLDAVAITDHDTTVAAERALDLGHRYDLTVVPGVEVSTADGHPLGLGISTDPPVGKPLVATVAWIRARGGVAVVPHPFQRSRHGVGGRNIDDVDAIETFNAWAMTGLQNRRASGFAKRHGYPGLGTSDAHRPEMVGTAWTDLAIEGTLTRERLSCSLRLGRCRAVGRSARTVEYARKYAESISRWTRTVGAALSAFGERVRPQYRPRFRK